MGGWCVRYGWIGGRHVRYGWIGGRKYGYKGGAGLALCKKKKGKNYAVFHFTGKRFFIYIYDVITWGK
jgi:hypothetical protein